VEIPLTPVSEGVTRRSEGVWLATLPPGKELLQVRASWPTEHWVLRLSAGSGAQPPWNPVVIRKSLRADLGRGGIVEFDVPAAAVGQETFTFDAPWFVRVESDPEQVELTDVSLAVSAAACLVDRNAEAADPQTMPFVPQGMRPGSVRGLGHDAFGYDGFQDVWAADYDSEEGGPLLAFLQAGADAQEASAAVTAYRDWLVAAGGVASDAAGIPGGVRVTLWDTHTVIFASGDLVMGVQEASSAQAAEALGQALLAWRSQR
jgi:hypothetical protein